MLRGWMHLVCFFLAVPAAIAMVVAASSPRARLGAAVYGIGLVALFGVSGAYHRGPWSPRWRARMRRLDHATIFVMIAGTYTPVCLLVLDGWVAVTMLAVTWAGALLGVTLAMRPASRAHVVHHGLYIGLGWVAMVAAPQLLRNLTVGEVTLVAIGGLLYTVGAGTLALRWPDPFPRIFGYHEVWHTLVVAAVVCQFVALASVVAGAGG
jgi:hemolysin III